MLEKFKIGHYTDTVNKTGVSVFLAEDGATGGCSVRGAAPATRETDLMNPLKSVQLINAVVLSGGSAFGLEAASGVQQYLYERGKGYDAGRYRVPIVVGASVYDLEYGNFGYPDKSAGYTAALNALPSNFERGAVGGAAGATVSKLCGAEAAVKTELGIQTYSMNGLEIAVFSVVNALGDIVDNGKIIAGALAPDGEPVGMKRILTLSSAEPKPSNTTISCILTNARLSKNEANILADLAHDGYAEAISPAHTMFDGDAVFVMASGEKEVEFNMMTALIPTLTAKAVRASVSKDTKHILGHVNPLLYSFFKQAFKHNRRDKR